MTTFFRLLCLVCRPAQESEIRAQAGSRRVEFAWETLPGLGQFCGRCFSSREGQWTRRREVAGRLSWLVTEVEG